MKQFVWHHALLVTITVVVLFTNLGTARLWDRDEPRNAGCAREMWEAADLVVPLFNGQSRDAKPVLLYWLIISAYGMFGFNEFAARFWSAALALGTVLATYHIGRRLFNARVGLWSAIILATALMFDVAGRAATPDSVLIFCSTMALLVYILGTFKQNRVDSDENAAPRLKNEGHYFPRSWATVALMYFFMGLGILAKGPVGLVLPTAVIGMFLLIVRLPNSRLSSSKDEPADGPVPGWSPLQVLSVLAVILLLDASATLGGLKILAIAVLVLAMIGFVWRRRDLQRLTSPFSPGHFFNTCWYMRPLTALAIALAVAAPWFVWVGLRTDGEFLHAFFVKEHFGRATLAMENHHGWPLFYFTTILIGFFPWSVFTGPVVVSLCQQLRRREAWNVGSIFLICWVCVFVGVFTLAKTKLPSYITPCYPALAVLVGCFMVRWIRGTARIAGYWLWLSLGSLTIAGIAQLAVIPIVARNLLPGDEWLGGIGLILILGAALGFVFLWNGRRNWVASSFAATAVVNAVVFFGLITVRVDRHQESHLLFDEIARRSDQPQLASFGCLESTWVYYARRPIRELSLNENDPASFVGLFLTDNPEPFVITTQEQFARLEEHLPPEIGVVKTVKYFLKDERLILLGRIDAVSIADRRRAPTGE